MSSASVLLPLLCLAVVSGVSGDARHMRRETEHRSDEGEWRAVHVRSSGTIELHDEQDTAEDSAEVKAVHARMMYPYPASPAPRKLVTGRYLIFDLDVGGLNNIRIGWEMAGLIAQHTNRTLVLPPARPYYLIDEGGTRSQVEDFLSLRRLRSGVPTLRFAEFAKKARKDLNLTAWMLKSHDGGKTDEELDSRWSEFIREHVARPSGNDPCDLRVYESDAKYLYARTKRGGSQERIFSCGDWASLGQPRMTVRGLPWRPPGAAWQLLRNAFTWHPDAFRVASRIVHGLGLFGYVALHARYNDFQYHDKRQSPEGIIGDLGFGEDGGFNDSAAASFLEMSMAASEVVLRSNDRALHLEEKHVRPFLGPGSRLYISTDETSPTFFEAFRKRGIHVTHWDDIKNETYDLSTERLHQLRGVIEQLICAYGRVFVGTELSTFSAYAHRMRIYADAPQKERLYHTVHRTEEQERRVRQELADWDAKGGAAHFNADADVPGLSEFLKYRI